jgi:hypothetical protein
MCSRSDVDVHIVSKTLQKYIRMTADGTSKGMSRPGGPCGPQVSNDGVAGCSCGVETYDHLSTRGDLDADCENINFMIE